jgi:hypothetical protein
MALMLGFVVIICTGTWTQSHHGTRRNNKTALTILRYLRIGRGGKWIRADDAASAWACGNSPAHSIVFFDIELWKRCTPGSIVCGACPSERVFVVRDRKRIKVAIKLILETTLFVK